MAWWHGHKDEVRSMHEDFEIQLMDLLTVLKSDARANDQASEQIAAIEAEESERAYAAMAV
jgi:hypothetical protein